MVHARKYRRLIAATLVRLRTRELSLKLNRMAA
jgi:hypothetical protein